MSSGHGKPDRLHITLYAEFMHTCHRWAVLQPSVRVLTNEIIFCRRHGGGLATALHVRRNGISSAFRICCSVIGEIFTARGL